MEARTPRVEFQGIVKKYPGVLALNGVSFSVSPGCVHAVVGENGAGKSTLMKILAGAVQADAGTLALDGRPVSPRGARHARQLGVAIVYQEFSLVPQLSAGENVFLGRWPRGAFGQVSFRELFLKAESVFDQLGVQLAVRRKVAELNVAHCQLVEIARALSFSAKVLVLDEPSAVLTPPELESLFQIVRRLSAGGVSVLYITHRLDEVFQLADWVTVLRDGRHVSTCCVAKTSREQIIREMVGRPIEEEFPPRQGDPKGTVLQVLDLSAGSRFRDVSLDVRSGEVLAITGLVGSGRTSLGKALFGAVPATRGRVTVGCVRGPFRSPRAAMRAGVAFLPEDRKQEGLLIHRSVRENISLADLKGFARAGVIRTRFERQMARMKLEEFGIKAPSTEAPTSHLSGGNQQKVMLARWLIQPYPVIILDEPTRGVDVGSREEIYGLINTVVSRGAAVLLITSELPEAIGMADRIGVMCRGRLMGILNNREVRVTQESLMQLAIGEALSAVRP